MKKLIAVLALAMIVIGATVGLAQSGAVLLEDTFTFDKNGAIISWDGSDPAGAPPYPYHMGSVALNSAFGGGYGSSIDVPFELGYLNNGFLSDCNPLTWSARTYTIGDGTHTGDEFTVHGATTCPYYTGEYGTDFNSNNRLDGFSVDANYLITWHRSCRYSRCVNYSTVVLQGGSGTVTDTAINQ